MQIILESPYDEYITKLIENGEFQNAEQVVKFALNEKFQFDQWDDHTISLIEEGLKEVEEERLIDITDDYKTEVIEGARKKYLNNNPIPVYVKP
jgi:Arc/MetJ-type ribon-helix-helix transcriptional regulator